MPLSYALPLLSHIGPGSRHKDKTKTPVLATRATRSIMRASRCPLRIISLMLYPHKLTAGSLSLPEDDESPMIPPRPYQNSLQHSNSNQTLPTSSTSSLWTWYDILLSTAPSEPAPSPPKKRKHNATNILKRFSRFLHVAPPTNTRCPSSYIGKTRERTGGKGGTLTTTCHKHRGWGQGDRNGSKIHSGKPPRNTKQHKNRKIGSLKHRYTKGEHDDNESTERLLPFVDLGHELEYESSSMPVPNPTFMQSNRDTLYNPIWNPVSPGSNATSIQPWSSMSPLSELLPSVYDSARDPNVPTNMRVEKGADADTDPEADTKFQHTPRHNVSHPHSPPGVASDSELGSGEDDTICGCCNNGVTHAHCVKHLIPTAPERSRRRLKLIRLLGPEAHLAVLINDLSVTEQRCIT
ncbi:hypothetical protein AMATHDRAFT_5965 [Amanita thiersii Skay4041]|uniref:Uncharacterized protein n=1 Tax=Amanita thiersii Skay4041 TaxID=703135 RepID=A0A2A9NIY4_9AGAR|nr:hypothetical protein AMATHDRAFT_5965 [Amanita thiersii Skay4041]